MLKQCAAHKCTLAITCCTHVQETTSNGWNTTAGARYNHHHKIKATLQSWFAQLRGSEARHAVLDRNSALSAKWQNLHNELLSHGQPQRTDCRPSQEKAGIVKKSAQPKTHSFCLTQRFWPKCGAAIEHSLKILAEACYFFTFCQTFHTQHKGRCRQVKTIFDVLIKLKRIPSQDAKVVLLYLKKPCADEVGNSGIFSHRYVL